MDTRTSVSRDFREETAQKVQVESKDQVSSAQMPGSELLGPPAAIRHRLPDERQAITHHFAVGGHEGYLTVGLYPNGQPGEIFIRMAKEGSTIAGLMECFGTVVSVSLQHGVPLRVLCNKLSHTRFEPSGWSGERGTGLREVHHGLPFPMARTPLPFGNATGSVFGARHSRLRSGRFREGCADFVTRI